MGEQWGSYTLTVLRQKGRSALHNDTQSPHNAFLFFFASFLIRRLENQRFLFRFVKSFKGKFQCPIEEKEGACLYAMGTAPNVSMEINERIDILEHDGQHLLRPQARVLARSDAVI